MVITRGHKIILIILAGIIAILLIIASFFWSNPDNQVKREEPTNAPAPDRVIEISKQELSQTDIDRRQIENAALSFTERFGTFSNQNGENIVSELKPVLSTSFYGWAVDQYVKTLRAEYGDGATYASVTTDAIAVEFLTLTTDKASVMVSANRQKVKAGQADVTITQKLKIDYIKENGNWVVDGAYWQK